MEVAHEELSKPEPGISRPRLQSLLELAVRTSSVAADTHVDNLSFKFDPRTLMDLMKAALSDPDPDTKLVSSRQPGCCSDSHSWCTRTMPLLQ